MIYINIREISMAEFKEFASNHPLGNFHQTLEYALLKAEEGYDYEFIGYTDRNHILAASLILTKKIDNILYGYAPRGFLIDYSNLPFLKEFTYQLITYYQNKQMAFLKINPEVAISKYDFNTQTFINNENYTIIDNLTLCGYKRLKTNMYFEALLPRVNAIVNLNDFNLNSISKNCRNKVKKGIRKGLVLEKCDFAQLDILYNFIKNKRNVDPYYYKDLFNTFSKSDNVDAFLVKVDFKKYLVNSQDKYNQELELNTKYNELIIKNADSKIINAKMNSDKALLSYKNDIAEASKYININLDLYIAGAIVIKYQNRIIIEISGFDKEYNRYSPNYFLYYAILNYYKDTFKYADLNGITADLSSSSPYYGLNQFKLGFKPALFEYIGEFDLPIDKNKYNYLLKSGNLAKEFNKQS